MSESHIPSASRYRLTVLVAAVLVVPLVALSPASPAGADPTMPIQVDGAAVTVVDGLVTVADDSVFTVPFINTGLSAVEVVEESRTLPGDNLTAAEQAALTAAGIDPLPTNGSADGFPDLVGDTCSGTILGTGSTCSITLELPTTWPITDAPFAVVLELISWDGSNDLVVARTVVVWPPGPPSPPPPPANDDFANAVDLSGLTIPDWPSTVTVTGDTTGATLEPGEMTAPDLLGSVWYRFTAPPGGFAGALGIHHSDPNFLITGLMAGSPDPWNPGLMHPSLLPGQVDRLADARGNTVVPAGLYPGFYYRMEPGHTLWIRVTAWQGAIYPGDGPFSFELTRAPVGNDPIGQAWDVWQGNPVPSGAGVSGDGTTHQVTLDLPGGAPEAWQTFLVDRPGTFDVTVNSEDAKGLPSDRPVGVRLYRAPTTSPVTDATQLGPPVASDTGGLGSKTVYLDGAWVALPEWTAALSDVPVSPGRYYLAIEAGSAGGSFYGISVLFSAAPPTEQIRIGDASVLEGDAGTRSLSFPITLSQPATTDVTVQVDVVPGTATPDVDYDAPSRSRTVTIPAGRTAKTVTVPVLQDLDVEGDETLTVELSNPSAPYVIADGVGVGTILDDDGFATPNVGIGDARIYEGTGGTLAGRLRLPITLSSPAVADLTVVATVYAGTADGSDLRLLTKPKRITFRPGTWKKTVSMLLYPDAVIEPDETITVVLSDPSSGLVIARSVGTGTIANDD